MMLTTVVAEAGRMVRLENGPDFFDMELSGVAVGPVALIGIPGEPFNGIARAIRKASPFKYTFIASLAQSQSGYVPMPECFERGGYEVQPGVNSCAPNAATEIIKAVIENL